MSVLREDRGAVEGGQRSVLREDRGAGGQPLETPHDRSGYREQPAEDLSRSSPDNWRSHAGAQP